MRRRQFIAGTAATATMGFARTVYAETNARPTGIKRVAIFHFTDPHPRLKAYFDELNRLGYIEGQNLIVQRYSALGHLDRIRDLAREIVASHPDVILPFSGPFLNELMALNTNIPMVGPTADPIPFGWTTSLARPDRNFTGAVIDAGLEIWAKRFQLLLESARKLTKVGFLAANPPTARLRKAHTCATPHTKLASRWLLSLSAESFLIERYTSGLLIPLLWSAKMSTELDTNERST